MIHLVKKTDLVELPRLSAYIPTLNLEQYFKVASI